MGDPLKRLLLTIIAVPLAAQTVTPTTVTLVPGQSVTLHSTAGKPYWLRSGTVVPGATFGPCAIGVADCTFTAPATIPTGATITTKIMVYDASNWAVDPAVATITLVSKPSDACQCRDGKDGAPSGDSFVISSKPPDRVVFNRQLDGSWAGGAPGIITDFVAVAQIYRNGNRVSEKDVVSISYNGLWVLKTAVPWPASDVVTAMIVRLP